MLFQAIRQGDLDTVKTLLEMNPELTASTAKQPKKDLGQSPLQASGPEIREFCCCGLSSGPGRGCEFYGGGGLRQSLADPRALRRHQRRRDVHPVECQQRGGLKILHTMEESDTAYWLLHRMTAMGADVNGVDSKGNSCLWHFCLQARQILPNYRTLGTNHVLMPELRSDLRRIFSLLREAGMDLGYVKPGEILAAAELYKHVSIVSFFTEE